MLTILLALALVASGPKPEVVGLDSLTRQAIAEGLRIQGMTEPELGFYKQWAIDSFFRLKLVDRLLDYPLEVPEYVGRAAQAVGVDEVYRIGGIPAIAALAVGTASCPAVDTVVGPGNIYVTLAKRRAYGRVNLDMLAGPSEVLVIADATADARFVAADLLSQAEHDVLAMCILLAVGDGVADAVQGEVARQLAALPAERRAVATESVQRFGRLVRCRDVAEACAISDRVAPEHLELLVADPAAALPRIRNAGAVFVGPWSPEPVGDYVAGPSHTLPTGGGARRWSGIGADTFMKRSSLINLGRDDFRAMAGAGIAMARAEGLEAHARAIEIRLT
mgnify:CR=1 FL=1